MFEFDNNKSGKVKVLNVTEARAHFSELLGDLSAHYVITKNNKPLRVVISYQEYQQITDWLKENDVDLNSALAPSSEQAVKPRKKSQTRVKGLLETHRQMQEEKLQKPKKSKSSRTTPAPEVDDEKKKLIEKLLGGGEQDYFADDVVEDEIVEAPIPQEIKPEETYQQIKNQIQEEELLDTSDFDDSDFDWEEKKAPEPVVKPQKEPSVDFKAESQDVDDGVSSEQKEYFEKYKKLYQSLGVQPEEKEEKIVPQPKKEPGIDFSRGFENEVQESADDLVDWNDEDPFEKELKAKLEQTQSRERVTQSQKKEQKSDLPSLKDLLQELEDEKLSGDDSEDNQKNINEGDIDDLIHRITNDY